MDLRLFEVFCRVYRERSFSRAARELSLTQPTVSAHIRELEDELGTPLFNRLGREIQPTEAGRFLYEHAKSLLSLKRSLVEKMAVFLKRVEGVLTVGASSVPGEYLLPALMTGFHAQHPGVRARLRITDTAETIDDLRHGDIELGVVGGVQADEDLLFEPLASDSLVLIVPATAQWKNRTQLTLRELRQVPLLVREAGSGNRTDLERALKQRKMSLSDFDIAAELGSMGAIKQAVKEGHGVSFVSELAIGYERRAGDLQVARVRELGVIRRTYHSVVSRRRVLSPVTQAFLEYLRGASVNARDGRTICRQAQGQTQDLTQMTLKIDVFNHIFPKPFFERLKEVTVNKGAIKRWLHIPFLHDTDVRFRMIDEFGDDYRQVLSLSAPPIESINPDRQITIDLARLANDSMAELVRTYPDRFPGFIASLPLNHADESVAELERAVNQLGALGVQIFSNVNGLPLDDERFFPLFQTADRLQVPRTAAPGARRWFCRLPGRAEVEIRDLVDLRLAVRNQCRDAAPGVFAAVRSAAGIRIVAHHLGAMIPYFEGRVGYGLDQFGTRTADEDYAGLLKSLNKRPYDYFKMFWADSAVFGSRAATVCGLDFFGTDQVVFASDAPFDPEGGSMYIRETLKVIDSLEISDAERHKIYQGNAEKLFNRTF